MNKILIIISIVLIASCSEKTESDSSSLTDTTKHTENLTDPLGLAIDKIDQDSINRVKTYILNKRLNFSKISSFFKYENVKGIDANLSYDKIQNKFRQLTESEYFEAFQDSSINYYGDAYYYYSKQKDLNNNKRYVFITYDESCCVYYYYNIYDTTGKKLSSTVIAASGGDGGWTIDSYCSMLNDSTIQQTTIECEYGLDDKENEVGDCDSTIIHYDLLENGSMKKEIALQRKIKR